MKCICGAQFKSPFEFFKHYTSPIHRDYMNLSKVYNDCGICYGLNKISRFVDCLTCKNKICLNCYTNIVNNNRVTKCPYCRDSRF